MIMFSCNLRSFCWNVTPTFTGWWKSSQKIQVDFCLTIISQKQGVKTHKIWWVFPLIFLLFFYPHFSLYFFNCFLASDRETVRGCRAPTEAPLFATEGLNESPRRPCLSRVVRGIGSPCCGTAGSWPWFFFVGPHP